ncbi:MAG: Maf family protein, partial [Amedibacillus dolichus]
KFKAQKTTINTGESQLFLRIASKHSWCKPLKTGLGKLFVRSIHGDYFNIVGLPIAKVYREIRNMQNSIEK